MNSLFLQRLGQRALIFHSWSKTRIFAASTINYYNSFSDNATIIWRRQKVAFKELQAKHLSGFNKIYIQHLNGYDKQPTNSFFPDECFVRWEIKIKVSSV